LTQILFFLRLSAFQLGTGKDRRTDGRTEKRTDGQYPYAA